MLANILEPTSYHEMAHMGQFAHTERPCKFKFSNPKRNLERYGQPEPPCYDLGRVSIEFISIYGGKDDLLISPGDLNTTCSQLSGEFALCTVPSLPSRTARPVPAAQSANLRPRDR